VTCGGFVSGRNLAESSLTNFLQRLAKCTRYAFCGWLAVCLTESQSWPLVFAMGKLRNPRRERFAVEVASMVPVDRAYLAAGFRSKPEWARPNGSKLAHIPEVAARISELRSEFAAGCALSVEYLQAKLLPAAELNIIDFFDADDKIKPISKLSRDQGAAVQSVKLHEDGTVAELRFVPKDAAVNTLLRSIGAFTEHHIHDVAVPLPGLADRLRAARERFATQLAVLSDDDQFALAKALEDGMAPELVDGDQAAGSHPTGEDQ
jgi:hypothetical protein